jgi:integrase
MSYLSVAGPYRHRARFRVWLTHLDGTRTYRAFDTEDEARAAIAATRTIEHPTPLREVLAGYLAHKRAAGLEKSSLITLGHRLRALLGDLGQPVQAWHAPAAWSRISTTQATDTQVGILTAGRKFLDWAKVQGHVRDNALAKVEVLGRRRRGKPQLRLDESRRFMAACLARATEPGPVAAAVALFMGLRAGEIVSRTVRDLDDNATTLWTDGDLKTAAATRHLVVPEPLRQPLRELAKGKAATDRLFGDLTRHGVLYWVKAMCRAAQVPVVTANGLRGTHSSLATVAGTSPEAVARCLGHQSFAVTQRHYVDPNALAGARATAVADALTRGN